MKINPAPILENLGGKGYHLNLLKDICKVPSFFVICFDNLQEIDNETVQKQILDYYNKNKYELVSVRSSATVEDSDKASFAGMFESVLNVNTENLIVAIKQVVESIKGQRVIDYCKLKEIDYNNVGMRVVIQKMINSRVSGVCFTKIQNDSNLLMIESCFGLGEGVVSGNVTPDTYLVDRNSFNIEKVTIGYQKTMLVNKEYEDVPFHKRNSKKLTNTEIEGLTKVALHIEENLKYKAVDIEWAYEKDNLYILQARAFTGIN